MAANGSILTWKVRRLWQWTFTCKVPLHVLRRGFIVGTCPICRKRTVFYATGPQFREQLWCPRCDSNSRMRAFMSVLDEIFPDWPSKRIHESSPGWGASVRLARQCPGYTPTQWFPAIPRGQMHKGVRCEDLEAQTFADASFDLVLTQDVFEHILAPEAAFAEIARTLVPGGCHVFTLPWHPECETVVRAVRDQGQVRHLVEPAYHGNSINTGRSLVVTDWGWNLCDVIYRTTGMTTTVFAVTDRHRGIQGPDVHVFVSRKPV